MKTRFKTALITLVFTSLLPINGIAGGITVDSLAKAGQSWNGANLPSYPAGEPEVSVIRVTVAPGTQLPWHKHPMINAGYLIEGALTVVAEGGKTLHLKAGDAIIELVDTWHYGRNDGDEDAVIVVFYAGTKGTPLSIKR